MSIDKELDEMIQSLFGDDEHQAAQKVVMESELSFCPNLFEPLTGDGYIEVRNHQLRIKDPVNNGKTPVMIPSKDLIITINGKVITKDTSVRESDRIEWKIKRKQPYEIIVSEDRMKVYLKLSSDLFKEFGLKDMRRSVRLMIELVETRRVIKTKQLYSAIIEELLDKGVTVETKADAIFGEIENPTFERVLIAEGLPLTQAKDAFLELLFPVQNQELFEVIDGKVDFRNRVKIPSVDAGELIAIVHPAVEGKHGYNVYGQELHPKSPKPLNIKAKAGAKLAGDGKIYATTKGRPTVTGRSIKYIDILPIYEINSDVDFKTGNIFFHGDVVVHGNVQENMRIETLGSIMIYGSVYSATIISAQNIDVKGVVINSKLYAGSHGLLYSQVLESALNLNLTLKKLVVAYNQLVTALTEKGSKVRNAYIFSVLIEKKFKSIFDEVRKLTDIIGDIENIKAGIPLQFKIFQRILKTTFQKRDSLFEQDLSNTMDSLLFSIKEVIALCENAIQEDSNINLSESDMSEIKTNGNVTFRKGGAVNSNVFAGKSCIIQGESAVVRGGKIHASKQIIGGIVGNIGRDCPHLIANEHIYLKELRHGKITMNRKTSYFENLLKEVKFEIEPTTNSMIYYSRGNEPRVTIETK